MKPAIAILMNLLSFLAHGQIRITPTGLTDSTQHILYIGVNNEIQISNIGEDYAVTARGGGATLSKKQPGIYILKVNAVTDDCFILVKDQSSGKILQSKKFEVRKIDTAEFNWKAGKIKRELLIHNPLLSIGIPGCYYRMDYKIISFDAYLDSEDYMQTFNIKGGHFTESLIEHLRKVEKGTILTLTNIRAIGADDEFRKLFTITIQIE